MFEILADGGAGFAVMGAGIGAGIAALAAGIGLGRIAHGRAEAIARQPEAAGEISGGSLLLGFLVEGVALFACVICILGVQAAGGLFAEEAAMVKKQTDNMGGGTSFVAPSTPGEEVAGLDAADSAIVLRDEE